jgi:hypothetical protein
MKLFGKYVDEMYLGNFRKDSDEINVRLKLWCKNADLSTHEYYELRTLMNIILNK